MEIGQSNYSPSISSPELRIARISSTESFLKVFCRDLLEH